MSLSDDSLEERIIQLQQSRNFWKWLARAQLLLLAVVIVAGVATSGLMAVRARQAEMIAVEEARRARDASVQAEEAAQAAEAERRDREKGRK